MLLQSLLHTGAVISNCTASHQRTQSFAALRQLPLEAPKTEEHLGSLPRWVLDYVLRLYFKRIKSRGGHLLRHGHMLGILWYTARGAGCRAGRHPANWLQTALLTNARVPKRPSGIGRSLPSGTLAMHRKTYHLPPQPHFCQTKETRDAAFGARLPVFTAPLLVFRKHKGGKEAYMTLVSLTCQQ